MPACLVIADDLTGANATGVQLSNLGFKSCTILDPDRINEKSLSSYDCILFPTDSRAIDQNEAYKRVLNAAHTFSWLPLIRSEIQLLSVQLPSPEFPA